MHTGQRLGQQLGRQRFDVVGGGDQEHPAAALGHPGQQAAQDAAGRAGAALPHTAASRWMGRVAQIDVALTLAFSARAPPTSL